MYIYVLASGPQYSMAEEFAATLISFTVVHGMCRHADGCDTRCLYLGCTHLSILQHNEDAWQHLETIHSRAGQATIAASRWPICAFYQ